ncbi:hypothetical protein GCM10029964_064590 [Kibdelosporangium lantanae]
MALPANTAVNSQTTTADVTPSANIIQEMPVGATIGGAAGALGLIGGGAWLWRRRGQKARHRATS